MKKRYIYSILFGIPGFFASLIIFFSAIAFAWGFLWLFVFGDSGTPSSLFDNNTIFVILAILVFLTIWSMFFIAGFHVGEKFESDPIMNKKHIALSLIISIACILFIVLQQMSVGNIVIGQRSDDAVCGDFCSQKGYSASGMPSQDSGNRICSCFDATGHAAIKIPIPDIH
jgi:hypothetical protein